LLIGLRLLLFPNFLCRTQSQVKIRAVGISQQNYRIESQGSRHRYGQRELPGLC